MAVSEKAKEKLDEASKEMKEALDNLKREVTELTNKVRERLKGTGEETRGAAEELSRDVKKLSERVKHLIPKKRRKTQLPVRVDRYPGFQREAWEQPFLELRKATDRLFDDFFRGFGRPMTAPMKGWELSTEGFTADWPRVNMDETDDEIRITAELPGVRRDDIDVSVSDDRVSIRGEKKEEEAQRERDYYRLERAYGSFQRSFPLPCEVDPERVEAAFKDGVLTVKLPKSAAALERIKKIPVRDA